MSEIGGTEYGAWSARQKTDRRGWARSIFFLTLAVECILIGCLIWGQSTSNRTLSRPLSQEEAGAYEKDLLSLPDAGGRAPSAAEVLAYCTMQGQKTIDGTRYTLYTSDTLPEYLHQCAAIREIMETAEGTVYITYTSRNAEQVTLTISGSGIMQKDIYAEKADTYYSLSAAGNHKYLYFRHSPSGLSPLAVSAAGRPCPRFFPCAVHKREALRKHSRPPRIRGNACVQDRQN